MAGEQPISPPDAFAAHVAVTAANWAFMLTDGALRMLMLLHFPTQSVSPGQLAYLFVFTESPGLSPTCRRAGSS